jgi:hypothetical protein
VYVYVCICIGSLRKWYSSFRTRHPHLSDRVSDCVDRKRIEAQHDGESIAHYYELLKAYADWHPSRIYAGDETGLDGDSARRTKILVPKNHKRAHKKGRGYREHTSFLFIADAEGKSLPPIVVHKGERIDADKAQQLPHDALIGCQSNGYFISNHFIQVLQHLHQHSTSVRPLLFIVDGAKAHLDLAAIEYAREHQIHVLCMPAHTSHILQVHDVSVFRPFKQAFKQGCNNTKRQRQRGNIPKEIRTTDIIPLAMHAMKIAMTADNIRAGFRKTGIHPYNPEIYKTSIPPPIQHTSALSILTAAVQQGSCISATTITTTVPPVVRDLLPLFSPPSDAVPPPPDKCNECGSDLKKKRVLPTCTQHASQNIYTTRVD